MDYQNNQQSRNLFIQEDFADHHYRTEIPNIVFDLDLPPLTFAVYAYLKRISGDGGKCWQSIPNIAKKIGIGLTKIRECLDELVNGKNKLNLKLINKNQRVKPDGSFDTSIYTIVNVWNINGNFYRQNGVIPKDAGVVQQKIEGTSPIGDKEEPSKKNPLYDKGNVLEEEAREKAKVEAMPFQKRESIEGIGKSKFPLKKEQRPIFELLKTASLECDDDTLKFLVRKYSEKKIKDALCHLKNEVERGMKFKRGRIAFFRHALDGNMSLVSERALKNRDYVTKLKAQNLFPSLQGHEKFCVCEKTQKEVPYDIDHKEFEKQLIYLFQLSKSY